uniref:Uncharacterized protein n=1 Tax=Arundo donax TaxID=35708 RepID=A0A0A8Z3Y7_ARUDO
MHLIIFRHCQSGGSATTNITKHKYITKKVTRVQTHIKEQNTE